MTFDTLRIKVGRRPITVVEIDLDFCSLSYGVSPCLAAIGSTGSVKCFNTFKTCQSKPQFANAPKTYRFVSEGSFLPVTEQSFPCITGVDIAPTQLNPKGVAVSASATVTFRDFPHHDRGIDPYATERTLDNAGSFFGKMRARNPFITGRPVRIMTGYIDDARVVYTRARNYIIDRLEGPDANGVVRLVCKDPLKFADGEKLKAPVESRGLLSANLSTGAHTFTLTPTGVGDEYPTSGRLRIGDELIDYTTRTGDTISGATRGVAGTQHAAHTAGDKVQLCKVYTNAYPDEIIYDLLVTYAGIDAALINTTEWAAERTTWLGSFTMSYTLSDPDAVKDLLNEVLLLSGSVLWWDEVEGEMRWKVVTVAPDVGDVPFIDDVSNILEGSLQVRELPNDRVSRVLTYFAPRGALVKKDKADFSSISAVIDVNSENDLSYGEEKTLEVFNRWVTSLPQIEAVAQRYIDRYKVLPRELTLRLDAKDLTLRTGDYVDVETRVLQGPTGAPQAARFLITETREINIGSHVEYKMVQLEEVAGRITRLITDDAQADWTLATTDERDTYMFISGDDGLMSDLEPAPLIS